MEQTNFVYPNFNSGQLLTSELLNNSVGYLDQQDRLTRANLIGVGIIEGLTYSYQNGALTVKAGTAITADGYLIHFPKDKTYRCYPKLLDPSFGVHNGKPLYSYPLYEDKNDAMEHGVENILLGVPSPEKYVVVLGVSFSGEKMVQCNQLTCDIEYTQQQYEVRPRLVAGLDRKPMYSKLTPIDVFSRVEPLTGFEMMTNVNVLSDKTKDLYCNNSQLLGKSVSDIVTVLGSVDWTSVSPEMSKNINRLRNCVDYFNKCADRKSIDESTEIPQFFLLFQKDVSDAVNEFVSFYNDFVGKYPFIRTQNEWLNHCVVIGKTDDDDNVYKYRFCPVRKDLSYENDCKVLNKLLRRIDALRLSFYETKYVGSDMAPKVEISFVPKNSYCAIGENSIPFYYDSKELNPYWNPFSLCENSISYPKPFLSRKACDMLFFQNCYGKDVSEVKSKLEESLKKYGITSVNVKTFGVDKRGVSKDQLDVLVNTFETKRPDIESQLSDLSDQQSSSENPNTGEELTGEVLVFDIAQKTAKKCDVRRLNSSLIHKMQSALTSILCVDASSTFLVSYITPSYSAFAPNKLRNFFQFIDVKIVDKAFAVTGSSSSVPGSGKLDTSLDITGRLDTTGKLDTAGKLDISKFDTSSSNVGKFDTSRIDELLNSGRAGDKEQDVKAYELLVANLLVNRIQKGMRDLRELLADALKNKPANLGKDFSLNESTEGKVRPSSVLGSGLSENVKKDYDLLANIFEAIIQQHLFFDRNGNGREADTPVFKVNASVICKVAKALSFSCEKRDFQGVNGSRVDEKDMILTPSVVRSILKEVKEGKPIQPKEVEIVKAALKSITLEEFCVFYEYIREIIGDKEKFTESDPYKNKYFSSFIDVKSYILMEYVPEYKDMVYCGGVRPNTDIVLIYSKSSKINKFLFELCDKKFKNIVDL